MGMSLSRVAKVVVLLVISLLSNNLIAQPCDTTFVRRIGSFGPSERAFKILPAPNGNLLIGGSKSNAALLMMVTPDGNIVWERTFDFSSGDDFVYEMLLDAEGKLVLVGRDVLNPASYSFAMRYDYQTHSVLWSRKMSSPTNTRFEGLLESPNGNFMVYGTTQTSGGGQDNLMLELNKSNGATTWIKSFSNGPTDVFLDAIIKNGAYYTANVQRYGSGIEKIRAAVSKLDISGNQLWTNSYVKDQTANARLYAYSINAVNDTLVVYGHGDLTGINDANYSLQLFTTDLNGNIIWAKNYQLPGTNHNAGKVVPVADGYVIHGTYTKALRTEIFIIKVNKQGTVVWAKSIGGTENETSRSMAYHDGYIYFVGHTNEFDTGQDILFGKMSLDGEILGPGCSYVETVQVTTSNLNNPYSGQANMSTVAVNFSLTNAVVPSVAVASPVVDIAGCGCQAPGVCSNLLLNASFENSFAGWSITGDVSTTADAHSGASAAKICGSSPGSVSQIYPAQAGESFTASIWAKTDNPPSNAFAQLRFLNASFTPLASGNDQQFFYSNVYDQYNLSAVAPTGTAYVHFMVWKQGNACTTFDEMELCKQVTIPILPDLTVTGLNVLSSPVAQGVALPVEFTLSNVGTGAVAGSYNVKIYASPTPTLGQNSVLMASISQQNTAVGAALNLSASPILPASFTPGNYYLVVVADSDLSVQESNENNNSAAVPFAIAPPNNCVGNLVLTTQAQVDAFPNCTVFDGSITIAGADIHDLTPLSMLQEVTNGLTIQNNPTLVSLAGLDNLVSVGTLTVSNNATLPACCGVFPLLNTNGVSGTVTIQNNLPGCNSEPEIISDCTPVGGGIDLSITIISPATAPIYTSYPVAVKVTNTGSLPATGVKVVCQKPTGVVYTGGNEFTATQGSFGPLTSQEWVVGSLAPGASATLTVNYFLLQNTLPVVYAQVTAANEPDADSTPNNGTPPTPNEDDEASSTGTPPPPPPAQPDLNLSDLVAPASTSPGIGNFTFTLKNTGNAAVQGNYHIGSFLSTDNVLSADDYQFATIPEQNTAVGSFNRTGSYLIPTGFTPGNYYLIVKVDVGSFITESNENNNTVSRPIAVTGVACNGNYILTTQAEVNAFPACDFVNGNLRIAGADIVDLTPLTSLTGVSGLLEIQNNTTLTSLAGLHNLTSVGGLLMSNNPVLASLSPLASLSSDAIFPLVVENHAALTNLNGLQGITGANYLRIQGNGNLQTLAGLDNLAIVRGEFLLVGNNSLQHLNHLPKLVTLQSNLILDDNPLLANLNGLSNLKNIGGILFVNGTNSLLDLQGLENVETMFGVDIKDNLLLQNVDALSGITSLNSLRVRDNAVLSDCCGLYPVLSANGVSGVIEISGNPSGCNSSLDIVANCTPQGVDLQMTMLATNPSPGIYTSFPVKLTITNSGGQAATGVSVHFPKPVGVVYVGGNEFTASKGAFNAFGNEQWYIGNLAAGESATLTVNYFLLTSNALKPFAQVVACNEPDPDSTPNNGASPNPAEDDETVVVINGFSGGSGNSIATSDNRRRLAFDRIYPNPAKYTVSFELHSRYDQSATLDFYNQQGQLVHTMEAQLEKGRNVLEVIVSDWKSGAYNMILRGEEGLPAYGRFLKIWEE